MSAESTNAISDSPLVCSDATIPAPTEVRFSIRSLLILTAIAAPVAAGVGVILRRVDASWQLRAVIALGASFAFLLVGAVYIAWRRRCAERLAGRVLFD